MKCDELLDIVHIFRLRHLQVGEDALDHLGAYIFVAVEGPAEPRLKALGAGLAHVVEQGGPAKPELVGGGGHVVEHLQRMAEIVFVPASLHRLDPLEGIELGQHGGQQAAFVHQQPTHRRAGGFHDFVQFVGNPFAGENREPAGVAANGVFGFRDDLEPQLGSEPDGAQHAQGIVAVGRIGIERGADDAVVEVADAAEGIHQRAVILAAEAESQCVDGEVTPLLIFLKGAVFHDGLAGIGPVGFAAGADEFDLHALVAQHRGAKTAEDGNFGPDPGGHRLREGDSAAFHHHIDIVAGTLEEPVAHVAADHEGADALCLSFGSDNLENLMIQCVGHSSASISAYVGRVVAVS